MSSSWQAKTTCTEGRYLTVETSLAAICKGTLRGTPARFKVKIRVGRCILRVRSGFIRYDKMNVKQVGQGISKSYRPDFCTSDTWNNDYLFHHL